MNTKRITVLISLALSALAGINSVPVKGSPSNEPDEIVCTPEEPRDVVYRITPLNDKGVRQGNCSKVRVTARNRIALRKLRQNGHVRYRVTIKRTNKVVQDLPFTPAAQWKIERD